MFKHLRNHGLVYTVLATSIFGFVLQTEMLQKVSKQGYQNPFFTMLITHCFMPLLLPLQVLATWNWRDHTFKSHCRKHFQSLIQFARTLPAFQTYQFSVYKYLLRTGLILALAVNLAGASWYIAIQLSSASDVTAIYNCSTFFAYGFSILLLNEKIETLKVCSVALSVIGVFIIAYSNPGDSNSQSIDLTNRTTGNIIIAMGTVLYGLYDVIYKKIACASNSETNNKMQAFFANFITFLIGLGTIVIAVPMLLFLNYTEIEKFKWPNNEVLPVFALSVVGNVIYSGSFLVLMALTNPVLGSISSLLATVCVPFIEYFSEGHKILRSEFVGGVVIILAFGLTAHASKID